MSQAAYIRDMMAGPVPEASAGPSEIANFYANQNIFLTGGCGFLGKLLVERLLRSCSDLKTLFLLVRAKRDKTSVERFNALFDDVIFDRLKRDKPGFMQKVVLIEGDMAEIGLGLSPDQKELLRSTNIVIHGAATVRFDVKLRIAANINVRGTKELISLAKEMKDLMAFVHISTAYSNCVSNIIEEKFYPPPMNCETLLNLLDMLDDTSLDHLTPVLLGRWPNTYAFTKAIAEDVVHNQCQRLPLCIVRPSIVIATLKEPVTGWINNVYGATGILVGGALGLLRTLHCDADLVADLIPADYVINNVIVAAWDIAKRQSLNDNCADITMSEEIEEPPIYNIVSSPQRPLTWGQLMRYTAKYGKDIPSVTCVWYLCLYLNKYRWVHNICVIFLHLIPAAILDGFAWLTGRKPMMLAAYRKIHKFSDVIEYFTLQQWRFDNSNVIQLRNKLSAADRSKFDLDIRSLNWEDYSYNHVRGLRVYLLKDPLDTVPQGRSRYAKLKIAHYTIITVSCFFLLWLLWKCLRFIGL